MLIKIFSEVLTVHDRWNLDPLYKGFDDPAFAADMDELTVCVKQWSVFVASLEQTDPLEGLLRGVQLEEIVHNLYNKLRSYANLRRHADNRDTEANSYREQIQALHSQAASDLATYHLWASRLPNLIALVKSDERLRDYEYLFANRQKNSGYLLPGMGEAVLAKLQLSGSTAWAGMRSYLTATVPVDYRGKTINFAQVRNLAYDADPQVRKDAYEAELAACKRMQDPVAFALNSLKMETISECQLRGYTSALDKALQQDNLERETIDAIMETVEEYLPKFWQYMKAKAKVLGYRGGLPWYDLFAPLGSTTATYTVQEARDYLVEVFGRFDKDVAELIATAFDDRWIDIYPREAKTGEAFCSQVDSIGQSRILMAFDGSFAGLVTFAHELGHAYHNQCLQPHRILNRSYCMPVAETASYFNECIVFSDAIQRAATKEEKLALLESQLRKASITVCDSFSRYLFETKIFENREAQFMHADTLCQMMLQAQDRAYGDGLATECKHPYMWLCRSHYYGFTFYNYPYIFGALLTRGLYARYQQEGAAFVPKYKKMLYATSVATPKDAAKEAGLDLTDKNFWRMAMKTYADQIDEFCKLVEE